MGIKFVSASSQLLENTAPLITAMPFTVGMWAYLPAVPLLAGQFPWSLNNNTSTNVNFYCINSTNTVWATQVFYPVSGSSTAQLAFSMAAGWYYVLARHISLTNRWIEVIQAGTGIIGHAQDTSSATAPTGVNRMALGCNDTSARIQFYDGIVAEFFYTNADIQADGGQLPDSTLNKLAYEGPFSIPQIAQNIVEYRSFRKGLGSIYDDPSENYWGGKGRQTWTAISSPTLGMHPPLSGNYLRPNQSKSLLLV